MAEHRHEFQGQALVHDHPGSGKPHGYFEHPEDGTKLEQAAQAAGEDMDWSAVQGHLHAAVLHQLPLIGGHDRHGPVPTDREAWRHASPEQIAEAITTFAMAGIGPVLFRSQVDNGLRVLRGALKLADIDPETLDWNATS